MHVCVPEPGHEHGDVRAWEWAKRVEVASARAPTCVIVGPRMATQALGVGVPRLGMSREVVMRIFGAVVDGAKIWGNFCFRKSGERSRFVAVDVALGLEARLGGLGLGFE